MVFAAEHDHGRTFNFSCNFEGVTRAQFRLWFILDRRIERHISADLRRRGNKRNAKPAAHAVADDADALGVDVIAREQKIPALADDVDEFVVARDFLNVLSLAEMMRSRMSKQMVEVRYERGVAEFCVIVCFR